MSEGYWMGEGVSHSVRDIKDKHLSFIFCCTPEINLKNWKKKNVLIENPIIGIWVCGKDSHIELNYKSN